MSGTTQQHVAKRCEICDGIGYTEDWRAEAEGSTIHTNRCPGCEGTGVMDDPELLAAIFFPEDLEAPPDTG